MESGDVSTLQILLKNCDDNSLLDALDANKQKPSDLVINNKKAEMCASLITEALQHKKKEIH